MTTTHLAPDEPAVDNEFRVAAPDDAQAAT
jgi:hypothetical protein